MSAAGPTSRPSVRLLAVVALAALGLGGCRCPRLVGDTSGATVESPTARPTTPARPSETEQARLAARGAVPGGTDGPGGFVARGSARNFYAGAAGRLWYYLNNYYWVPADLAAEGVWIRAEVRADFVNLVRWPERTALRSPPTKSTVEYWAIGPGRRSVRLDNHKDFWVLDPKTCAGSARVQVTLTLGRVQVQDLKGAWGAPSENYVLESRNYRDHQEPGIGATRVRFVPLADRPTSTWGYTLPWSTGESPLTRSTWVEQQTPTWKLIDVVAAPPAPLAPRPPEVTVGDPDGP